MKKRIQNARSDARKPRTRISTRALALVAAFSLVMSMCPGTAALAFANEQLTVVPTDGTELRTAGQFDDFREVTEGTYVMASGSYIVKRDVTIKANKRANGLKLNRGAKVFIYIEKDCTLTVLGYDGSEKNRGGAGILLPSKTTLVVAGDGKLVAKGGKGGPGRNGGNAGGNEVNIDDGIAHVGAGGAGGMGGSGAGAGIGTDGATGVYSVGGRGGKAVIEDGHSVRSNVYGNDGAAGADGRTAEEPGTLIVTGNVTVEATGGAPGTSGKAGSKGGYAVDRTAGTGTACGTSGGGGGGGGGSAGEGIGYGGSAGGGGGGGASGNIDGECAGWVADLDNLWSHGGGGGACWGNDGGSNGEEGASGGDGNGKYAKSGGKGGASPAPKPVTFYTYKDQSSTTGPKVICSSGHGVTREATVLGSLSALKSLPGCGAIVSGGTWPYDGKQHGASVGDKSNLQSQSGGSGALRTQAEGDEAGEEWPDQGTVEIDGVEVNYSITYYDEAGNDIGSAPVMPGQYAVVVSFTCDDPEVGDDYTGYWIEQITITKRQVAKPEPKSLVFECENWATGEGALQDAFPGLDETDYEFVSDAEAPDGSTSLRSARDAGDYQACFRLKDPAMCEWEDGTEGADAWVPWSIKLAPFDPNSKEITYWGTAHDNTTTTVTYTGEPIWVRPWYTPAKSTDGKFPEWFTHWGSADRPTTDKRSAIVMYFKGDDDYEGLVGYHENADGSLEPVTGEQVYAWMFGVDIDGVHVPVQAGDKVWYKTDAEGWKVPIAVQSGSGGAQAPLATQAEEPEGADVQLTTQSEEPAGEGVQLTAQAEEPEGAEGYVVARDYAYADRLGVRDVGTYHAYAYFDEGAGFAAISLAEANVEVKATSGAGAKASAAAKTGDFSPLVIGGIAVIAIIAAGAFALSLARRRR